MLTSLARRPAAAVLAGLVCAAAVAPLAPVAAQTPPLAPAARAVPADLPAGVPAAATRPEPRLQAPDGWPFAQRISRTGGTGRLHGGASYWTDFVYDDKGAAVPSGFTVDNVATLAPEQGAFEYPAGPASGNGADVFVAAVGLDSRASWWRVDWTTLEDADVPLAVWTFDTDADRSTGEAAWPAAAGVTSAGIEQALVVSSRGAWLHDLATGRTTDVADRGGSVTVDEGARSFVVRVPRRLLPVDGTWRVRLGAGLADADGESLAQPVVAGGLPLEQLLGLPRLYNVAFRTPAQEAPVVTETTTAGLVAALQAVAAASPVVGQLGVDGQARFVTGNFWMEDTQADALASGDVGRFAHLVRWRDLAADRRTPEPLVRGWSNRWYTTRLDLGAGVVQDEGQGPGDGRPNYLSPVQPYSVYVPTTYDRRDPAPLTWLLHSLSVNHNQYGAYDPVTIQQLCEDRGSICAGTLGHGPDGWYFDEAEHDYWQVWRQLADAFALDPARTVIGGYSMGGWASYHLGLAHPDLYAAAISLAGPPVCGVSLDGDALANPAFGGRCESDGQVDDLLGNARWVPWRIGHGFADQLVPFTSVEAHVARMDALDLRHRFVRYPGEDHLLFAVQDRFDAVLGGLGTPTRVRNPRTVDFTWRPRLTRPRLGIGATTAYWVTGLSARDAAPGSLARVEAESQALRDLGPGEVVRTGPEPVAEPLPASVSETSWVGSASSPQRQRLTLRLVNVRSLTVDADRARLRCGARLDVVTDGPTRLLVRDLRRPGGGTRSFRFVLDGDGTATETRRLGCGSGGPEFFVIGQPATADGPVARR